jgi:hypothetical protein
LEIEECSEIGGWKVNGSGDGGGVEGGRRRRRRSGRIGE